MNSKLDTKHADQIEIFSRLLYTPLLELKTLTDHELDVIMSKISAQLGLITDNLCHGDWESHSLRE